MSSARLYLLVALLLLFFFNFHGSKANFLASTNCPIYRCDNELDFHYPFWKIEDSTAHQHCGYPGFGLTCSDSGEPILTLPNDSFIVKDINFPTSTITLVDIDVVNQTCPRARHSMSVGTLPLDYSPLDVNLSFYFNCTSFPDPVVPPITCLGSHGTKKSYVITEGEEPYGFEWSEYCAENVVVTVKKTEEITRSIGELIGAFGLAMNNGFVLNWTMDKECGSCETNGGFCGYNNTAPEILCFCKDGSIGTTSNGLCKKLGTKFNWRLKVVIGVVATIAGTGILVFVILFRGISLISENDNGDAEAFIQNIGPLAVKRYIFSDVRKMTNSFKDKLGQGGYGDVYEGKLLNGCRVAVKVLKASKGNGEDFVNEVASISRTSHVNVVTLLGYCIAGKKTALIYEFMPNGSLEKFIYKDSNLLTITPHLELEKLFQIAIGIARGLEYLHRGCNTRILHFDIKPHNILLDENFFPKISDFGLSKLCTRKESIISMLDARGTIGYMAPEVFSRNFGRVSAKSDVYSYAMMILEMVGGRKNVDARVSHTSEIYFPDWVYEHLEQGSNFGLLSAATEEEKELAKKMFLVGLWCIQTKPSDRPSMSKVIEMLEGSTEALQIPPKPVLSSPVQQFSTDKSKSIV
ncbi:LEAF RUST 10 DISEASE-RESISTANCE LOCUS RECEPTOR-LIKE PROTEIN KINASE-like 2.1 isoform X2 [Rosa chinensis]|uniref:LEAF RUST 10 DISEASE-RESISTANCE LOCUS RECEPTOR-LIKE PROTEIN KINASE-like 2.1 isoform X2 n=1 Tax=Rosa chinensis TaxID=74649 RepID=UPI000D09351A|nr:LEAF RUST 10 DISEASE-RESISTANCE LOCUS RECEPTOR-LIKE PROTEIN KINASE-like 2.1 isoform X2 [Rosa chinensis]